MNVFLQGDPGVGKSTIIKKVLTELDIQPSGFLTITGNGQSKVYIYEANSSERSESVENLIGERLGEGAFNFYTETFEKTGIEILNKVEAPLILMDEIGFMENQAFQYQKRLLEVLMGEVSVLGVIKEKETEFIKKIIENEKNTIIKVNRENRESVYKHVLEIMKKAI